MVAVDTTTPQDLSVLWKRYGRKDMQQSTINFSCPAYVPQWVQDAALPVLEKMGCTTGSITWDPLVAPGYWIVTAMPQNADVFYIADERPVRIVGGICPHCGEALG
jgi:hypothetical protein